MQHCVVMGYLLTIQSPLLLTLTEIAFDNIVGKEKHAFPTMFSTLANTGMLNFSSITYRWVSATLS